MPRWEAYDGEGRFLVLDTASGGGIRMARGRVTAEEAIAGVVADPSLTTAEAKCAVYRSFVRWSYNPSPSAYPMLVDGACARFPLGP